MRVYLSHPLNGREENRERRRRSECLFGVHRDGGVVRILRGVCCGYVVSFVGGLYARYGSMRGLIITIGLYVLGAVLWIWEVVDRWTMFFSRFARRRF